MSASPSVRDFRAPVPAPGRGRGALAPALALLLLLAACARPAPLGEPMRVSFLPAPGELLSAQGDRLAAEGLMALAQNASYILIGESHGNPCDHEAERRILTLLAHGAGGMEGGRPGRLALGLEMVPARLTPVLEDYAAGKFPPGELEARLDWKRSWGHPFAGYAPLFELARQWKLPLAGLNVSPVVIRRLSAAALDKATAADPVAALSPEDRAELPREIIPPAPEQLAFLRSVMASHPKGGANAAGADDPRQTARFLLIQGVWDTAMAEQAAALRRRTGLPVAVLAGAAHVENGLGIARRLRLLDPGAEVLLISPWRGFDLDPAEAAVRVYCPESFQSRLGMTLELRPFGAQEQVVVGAVARGGRAEAAGLRPGDVVLRAGSHLMRSLGALHLAGSDAYRDRKNLVLEIERGPERYSVDLGPLGQPRPGAGR